MALTLEQYATYLDTRDLAWPAPPEIERPKAKPHLSRIKGLKAVLWNVYGTLLAVPGGDLCFEHPQKILMDAALDKTVQEFKMWSMSRKPGQPAEYLAQLYANALAEQKGVSTGGEHYPDATAERVWEAIIKKLLQKDYKWDAGFFGSLNEFSKKLAYFFHASLQGSACYPGAGEALRAVADSGRSQGLLGEGQCFTPLQLQRALARVGEKKPVDELISAEFRFLSGEVRCKKPSEKLFRHALQKLSEKGISATEVLHVGSRVTLDLVPARRHGMKTALFAGDRSSLQATPEQMKDYATRPDVLLTELPQIAEVLG